MIVCSVVAGPYLLQTLTYVRPNDGEGKNQANMIRLVANLKEHSRVHRLVLFIEVCAPPDVVVPGAVGVL